MIFVSSTLKTWSYDINVVWIEFTAILLEISEFRLRQCQGSLRFFSIEDYLISKQFFIDNTQLLWRNFSIELDP